MCVALAFGESVGFPFLPYDDDQYVSANPVVLAGLTLDGTVWAFSPHASNWFPLTWLSHMLDVELFGPGPAGPACGEPWALHALNSALFFWLLNGLTRAPGLRRRSRAAVRPAPAAR